MHFSVLTIFPEFFSSPLGCGLLGKAAEEGLVSFSLVNPRDFATDKHRSVDDRPFGGGPGMVMMLGPLHRALQSVPNRGRTLLLSPKGRRLDQELAWELAQEDDLTLICGRYEGVDSRLEDLEDLEPVSVGDYVLNGGEAGALCLIEAVARLLPRFMGKEDSVHEESFSSGLLEYPQYTRPRDYSGLRVPKVLLSGDHAAISRWRREQALRSTLEHRPSLLSQEGLSEADLAYLRQIDRPCRGRNLYFALLHYPVVTKSGEVGSTSLTNLDIHDIGCVSCSYGLGGCYLVTPLADQRDLAQRLLDYWLKGAGRQTNPDRAQALAHMWIVSGLSAVKEDLHRWTGHLPLVLASSAQRKGDIGFDRVYALLERRPVLVLLGTGFGLAQEVLDQADALLPSLRWLSIYNHLSVRSSAAIYADRILHDGQ